MHFCLKNADVSIFRKKNNFGRLTFTFCIYVENFIIIGFVDLKLFKILYLTTSRKRHFLTSLKGFCSINPVHVKESIQHSVHFVPTYNKLLLSLKQSFERGWNRCAFITENLLQAVNCLSKLNLY